MKNLKKYWKIVKDNPKIKGIEFAKLMWKDSKMHNQSDKIVNRNGLYYMFKLVKRNWLTEHNWKFEITKEGLSVLKKIV